MSRDLPEHLAVELVLQGTVLEAGANDVLDGMNVEGEVNAGELGVEEVTDVLEELLGGHVEGGGGEGGEGVLQGTGDAAEDRVFPVGVVNRVGRVPGHDLSDEFLRLGELQVLFPALDGAEVVVP